MTNKSLLFIAGLSSLLLSSCLGGDEIDTSTYSDCRISSYSLSHDSIAALSDVHFTIDQLNGEIFNIDSMPYGTIIDRKVVATFTYGSGGRAMQIVSSLANDTVWATGTDSIDVSAPLYYITHAYDNITTKKYRAVLNIHQVNPDTMLWSQSSYGGTSVSGTTSEKVVAYNTTNNAETYLRYFTTNEGGYRLFESVFANNRYDWSESPISGLPSKGLLLDQLTVLDGKIYLLSDSGSIYVSEDKYSFREIKSEDAKPIALIGAIEATPRQESALALLVEKDGERQHALLNETETMQYGDNVPNDFPMRGMATTSFESMEYSRIFIAGGVNTSGDISANSWITLDGLEWVKINTEEDNAFGSIRDASIVAYDDRLFLLGGFDESNTATKNIYVSPDEGVTWATDTMYVLPDNYSARGKMSVVVNGEQFIHLFGGILTDDAEVLNEVWQGRINRLGFENQD